MTERQARELRFIANVHGGWMIIDGCCTPLTYPFRDLVSLVRSLRGYT